MSCESVNGDASPIRMPFPKGKRLKLKSKRKNQVTYKSLDPTERKPTPPSKVSIGSKKRQKTNEEEVEFCGTIQSIFRTEEGQLSKTLEAEYFGYQPSEVEDPRMVKHQSLRTKDAHKQLARTSYVIVCVACLFRLVELRTSYVICVACLFRFIALRTSYATCVACLFRLRA